MIIKHRLLYAPDAAVAAPPVAAPAPAKPAAPDATQGASDGPSDAPTGGPDPFDDLDKKWSENDVEPEPAKEPVKAPEKPVKQPDKSEPAKEPVKPVVDDLNTKTPKQLRERLQAVQAEKDANASKITQYEKKIADLEKNGQDSTKAVERLVALEKERDELKGQLRVARFESSDDFKKNFEAPFNEMAKDAQADITQLQIAEQVDGEGNVTPGRAATWKDFTQIYAMDRVTARAVMKRAFGEDAPLVMEHYDALKRLDRQQGNALQKEKSEWSENAKSEQANREKQQQFIAATWTKLNTEIAERPEHAEFMKADLTKPEETKLLEEGAALVDAKPQTLENRILRDAHVRLRAIAYPRLKHMVTSLRKQLAERDAKIAELMDSDPATGGTRRVGEDGQVGGGKTEEQELQEIMNQS